MASRQPTSLAADAAAVAALRSDAMPHGDILASYVALLCMGKSDFEAIDAFQADAYFHTALGLGQVPSAATLRQRLDAHAAGFPECRRAQDAKRDVQVTLSPSARRQPLCSGAPRSGVTASARHAPCGALPRLAMTPARMA